jgi:hypothetical protein
MGLTGCPETSLTNLQPTRRNIPEERRPQMDRRGSVVSPEDHFLCSVWNWTSVYLFISYVWLCGLKCRLSDLNTSTYTSFCIERLYKIVATLKNLIQNRSHLVSKAVLRTITWSKHKKITCPKLIKLLETFCEISIYFPLFQ